MQEKKKNTQTHGMPEGDVSAERDETESEAAAARGAAAPDLAAFLVETGETEREEDNRENTKRKEKESLSGVRAVAEGKKNNTGSKRNRGKPLWSSVHFDPRAQTLLQQQQSWEK